MASVVNRSQFPSRSTGQLFFLTEYDDGSMTCTCSAGASRGHMKAGGLICWHVRDYRIQTAFADLELQPHIPSSTPAQVVGLNVNDWVWRLAGMFCPVDYLLEIVASILKQDDVELAKILSKPLPEFSRSVLEKLCLALETMAHLPDAPSNDPGHEADSIAYHLMQGALSVRGGADPQSLAWQIHQGMVNAASGGA